MSEPMRALTVRQPWATAIIWGGKDIENRTRPTGYRGRLWIHAGLHRPDRDDYLEASGLARTETGDGLDWAAISRSLGVILGSVDVVGCHSDETEEPRTSCSPWARHSQHHWMLANPRPLAEPVPCKGALGLWRLPEDVEKAVRAQLATDIPAACPESKMDDGSHSDELDGGCAWCGAGAAELEGRDG